ncbi:hypothetical protein RYX36_017238, partial [Vicia faba]
MEAIVGGALLSASMEMLVKKVVSGEFLDLFRRTKLDVDLLEKLEITLLSLQSVLHDAEDKQIANPAVKKWLEMLQDAVFEADDLFDELNTEALRCQAEGGQVLNKFLSYFKRFNKKINSKLQKLFGRLEHLKDQNLGLKEGDSNCVWNATPTSPFLRDESAIYGRDDDRKKLKEFLLLEDGCDSGSKIGVISIVGMGGLGKTTLAKLLYNDPRVKEMFEVEGWAHIPKDFNVATITKTILELDNDKPSERVDKRVRHLSYNKSVYEPEDKFDELHGLKGLRTFLATHAISLELFSDLLSTMTQLHALELSCCINMVELPKSIGNLICLRYLDLSTTQIKRLPSETCKLYNLQTLLLSFTELIELPKDMGKLVKLRHLDIRDTKLKKMPAQISKLENLQTLSDFIVSSVKEVGLKIEDLGKYPHLSGSLCISQLENVTDPSHASQANLEMKMEIDELELGWSYTAPSNSEIQSFVLERLRPSTNLKRLTISGYSGDKLPNWLGDRSMICLQKMTLKNIPSLTFFPSDCLPKTLQSLNIDGCDSFTSFTLCSLPVLKILSIVCCKLLKSILIAEDASKQNLLFLRTIYIWKCNELESVSLIGLPIPNLTHLSVTRCEKLRSLPESIKTLTSLQNMEIVDLPNLQSFSIDELPISLRYLTIGKVGGIWWNTTWEHLTSLSMLETWGDDIVKGLIERQVPFLPTNLVSLRIYWLEDVECLDGKWLQHLTSLHTLEIWMSPKLKSLPEKGDLPSSLKQLHIKSCPLLEPNLKMKQGKEWLKISHIPEIYFLSYFKRFNKKINSKLQKLFGRLEHLKDQNLGLKEGDSNCVWNATPTSPFLRDESAIYGRDDDRKKLKEFLLLEDGCDSGRKIGVISIVGMGGLGKTTLAKLLYNDPRVKEMFEVEGWAHIPKDFNVATVTKTILESVTLDTSTDTNLLKLQIIITTRDERVVLPTLKYLCVHHLRSLEIEDSWSLLARHAFVETNYQQHPNLEIIGREIAKKCGGLPLAAVALGGILRTNLSQDHWNDVLNNSIWEHTNDEVQPALLLSYREIVDKRVRHLSYNKSVYEPEDKFDELHGLKGLRTFLATPLGYSNNPISLKLFSDLLSTMTQLHVLSLSYCINIVELPKSIGNLICLRYLNLSDTQIKRLPSETCKLYNLQTLLLSFTELIELPKDMGKLVKLRHLDIRGTKLKKMPAQISKLENLQTLSDFIVSSVKEVGLKIEDLGKYPHLSGRLCISQLENVTDPSHASQANLEMKKEIDKLKLGWSYITPLNSEIQNVVLERLR